MKLVALRIYKDWKKALEEGNQTAAALLYDVYTSLQGNSKMYPGVRKELDELGVKKLFDATKKQLHEWFSKLDVKSEVDFFDGKVWAKASVVSFKDKKAKLATLKFRGFSDKYNVDVSLVIAPLSAKEDLPVNIRFPRTRVGVSDKRFSINDKEKGKGDDEREGEQTADPAAAAVAATPAAEADAGGRRRSAKGSAAAAAAAASASAAAAAGGKRKAKAGAEEDQEEEEEKDEHDFICSSCRQFESREGDNILLCCDASCKRAYHLTCLKLDQPPEGEYYCDDCDTAQHYCFVCNERGADWQLPSGSASASGAAVETGEADAPEGSEGVHKCNVRLCGKYYHPSCLAKGGGRFGKEPPASTTRQVKAPSALPFTAPSVKMVVKEVPIVERDEAGVAKFVSKQLLAAHFKCPHHVCDTCSDFYASGGAALKKAYAVGSTELFGCLCCPRAFHVNCMPPGARFNSLCVICPLHPEATLPDKDTFRASKNKASALLFDHLALPDDPPRKEDPLDNHFKLPLRIRDNVLDAQSPKEFKIISRLDYDLMKGKAMPSYSEVNKDQDRDVCSCVGFCGEECINRIMKVECCGEALAAGEDDVKAARRAAAASKKGLVNCGVGPGCGNRGFEEKDYAKTERFREHAMGFGLRAAGPIPEGRFVLEYIGEVIDTEEMVSRMENQRKFHPNDHDFYIMEMDLGVYVDGKHKGNESRFINHSCDPNCELERFVVKGKKRIGIFAIKDIKPGEPLSYDYQFETEEAKAFKCFCGSENCRGTMAPRLRQEKNEISKAERRRCISYGKQIVNQRLRGDLNLTAADYYGRLNCVGATMPGDKVHQISSGAQFQYHQFARQASLFLPRTISTLGDIWARRALMWQTSAERRYPSVFSYGRGAGGASRRGAATKGGAAAGAGGASKRSRPRGTTAAAAADDDEQGQGRRSSRQAGRVDYSKIAGDSDDDDDGDDDASEQEKVPRGKRARRAPAEAEAEVEAEAETMAVVEPEAGAEA